MRVLLFGPYGVLGRALTRIAVQKEHVVIPVSRNMCDYLNLESLKKCVTDSQPDVVVNAAGLTQTTSDIFDVISINGLFPHLLLRVVDSIPIIHMSSTEVFSGRIGDKYSTTDIPDPRDYLGRSRSLGEILGPNVCVIRTSMLALDHGFMKFVFNNKNIEAWDNAILTPGIVDDVCEVILWLIDRMLEDRRYSGIVHLATEQKISKYELACLINELFSLGATIKPVYAPRINRALAPTVILRPIREALNSYASDFTINQAAAQLRKAGSTVS